jgi:hypothetical protein
VKILKKLIASTAAGTALFLNAAYVIAADINLEPKDSNFQRLTQGTSDPGGLISKLIRLLLVVASIVFFFMLVIGGIKWILSGGDKGKTEEARNQITAALVGLVIVFSAWAIAKLIEAFFGVNIINLKLDF